MTKIYEFDIRGLSNFIRECIDSKVSYYTLAEAIYDSKVSYTLAEAIYEIIIDDIVDFIEDCEVNDND